MDQKKKKYRMLLVQLSCAVFWRVMPQRGHSAEVRGVWKEVLCM